jgi:hypothetical protein
MNKACTHAFSGTGVNGYEAGSAVKNTSMHARLRDAPFKGRLMEIVYLLGYLAEDNTVAINLCTHSAFKFLNH